MTILEHVESHASYVNVLRKLKRLTVCTKGILRGAIYGMTNYKDSKFPSRFTQIVTPFADLAVTTIGSTVTPVNSVIIHSTCLEEPTIAGVV